MLKSIIFDILQMRKIEKKREKRRNRKIRLKRKGVNFYFKRIEKLHKRYRLQTFRNNDT